MKIRLTNPDNNYASTVDTEVMDAEIKEAFIGPTFVTADGERLSVCMRDSGFEVCYIARDGAEPQWFSFQGGLVSPRPDEMRDETIELAWGLIANAWNGNWDEAGDQWRGAAERWRDNNYINDNPCSKVIK